MSSKLPIPSWDEYFMRHVYLAASKSKDQSTQIGAVVVRDGSIISEGYNGLCRGLDDNIPARHERPEKYFWFEHGERNSIYNAARAGISTLGAVMFTQGIPCADCARAVIQAGIKKIIVHECWEPPGNDSNRPKWNESCARGEEMLRGAGVTIEFFKGVLGLKTLKNGEVIDV